MRFSALALVASTIILGACGREEGYTPNAGADPKAVFESACLGCHMPTISGKAMALSAQNNNPAAVAAKIGRGSMSMPKFPNIQGAELEALSEWVVDNAELKP